MSISENNVGSNEELKSTDGEHPDLNPETAGAFVLSEEGDIIEIEPQNPDEFYGGQRDEKTEEKIIQKSSLRERMEHFFNEITLAVGNRIYLEERVDDLKKRYHEITQRLALRTKLGEKKVLNAEKIKLFSQLNEKLNKEIPKKEEELKNLIDDLNNVLARIDKETEREEN